jgi:hypothetical protein
VRGNECTCCSGAWSEDLTWLVLCMFVLGQAPNELGLVSKMWDLSWAWVWAWTRNKASRHVLLMG